MTNGKLLRKLIKAGATGDAESFRAASEAVIAEERVKQHHLLANDLEKILYGRATLPAQPALRRLAEAIPVDKERSLPLLDVRQPVRGLEDIVLSDENRSMFDELLQEHARSEALQSYGLQPVDRVLLCGPPGCGKTITAEVLAHELSLPLAVVRIDTVVSSYLGETAASLRNIFEFIEASPMVVLFDEFDALAKERSDTADHGELKRVVNAVLQMMDAYRGQSIIVAATNHERILDSAVWRRFNEVLFLDYPNLEQIKKLIATKLRGVRRDFDIEDRNVAGLFKGMSHADIERTLIRAIKEMILHGSEFLRMAHIETSVRRENSRRARFKTTSDA